MTYIQDAKGSSSKVQTATANPKLIKLEPEIRRNKHRMRAGSDRASTLVRILDAVDRSAVKTITSAKPVVRASSAIIRKLFYVAFRGAHRPIERKPAASRPVASAFRKSSVPAKTNMLGRLALSACLGLTAFCAIMVLILLLQMRDSAAKIDRLERELATTRANLSRLENKVDVPQPAPKEASAAKARPPHMPLSLAMPEIKLIRESIKVLPPKPDAKETIHLGDAVSTLSSAPVPDSLVEQLPKLRGARFSIDQNGAIIIIGPGSSQADAVIGYR